MTQDEINQYIEHKGYSLYLNMLAQDYANSLYSRHKNIELMEQGIDEAYERLNQEEN